MRIMTKGPNIYCALSPPAMQADAAYIYAAPFTLRALAHSFIVAPVVNTSSIISIRLFFTLPLAENAFFMFSAR